MCLLQEIQRHLASYGMSETRFGREALGDPRLVSDIRRGRDLRLSTCRRIRAFMAAQAAAASR